MTTTGTYVEANGLRVYYEVYGEDEVLGRLGVSEESGRFNSTVYGLRRAEYRARPPAAVWLSSRSRSRFVKCRSGKGKAIAYHVVPDSPTALSYPCGTRRISQASWRSSAWPTTSPPITQTMLVHNAVKEVNKPTRGDGS